VEISTGDGPARAEITWPAGAAPPFLLVLTHGSGRPPDSADLLAVRAAALPLGGAVALVTQPYVVKGRRAPGPVGRQDAAWLDIVAALRAATRRGPPGPAESSRWPSRCTRRVTRSAPGRPSWPRPAPMCW